MIKEEERLLKGMDEETEEYKEQLRQVTGLKKQQEGMESIHEDKIQQEKKYSK